MVGPSSVQSGDLGAELMGGMLLIWQEVKSKFDGPIDWNSFGEAFKIKFIVTVA